MAEWKTSATNNIFQKGNEDYKERNLGFRSYKGVHPFIAATMLILVTVVLATIVSGFVVNVSSERSNAILNTTQTKLSCQYAGLLVTNVTYDCNSACFTGSPYKINATIENTGSSKIHVSSLFVTLTDGTSYRLDGNSTSFSAGDVTTKLFNSVLVYSNPKMPTETMDTRNEYVNGSNTNLLCHFESTPACIARTDGSGNAAGVSYESGKFGNGIKINETDTLTYNATANINSTQGTIEFWLAPNWSADNTRKSFISLRSLDANVSGQWQFEDKYYNVSLKNITDFSPYGNNGTYVGEAFSNGTIVGANRTTGKYGSALMFNGTDPQTYVVATESSALNISGYGITLETWIYVKGRNTHASREYIIHKGVNNAPGGGYFIQFDHEQNNTQFAVFTNDTGTISSATSTNSVLINRWYHVAATYNGSRAVMYVNGIRDGAGDGYGTINTTTNPFTIGLRSDYPNVPFNGTIDEVRIYNYALTDLEINTSMNSAYPVNRTVASYKFEEQAGSTAYDTHHQVAGQYGGAAGFDGTDDVISITNPVVFNVTNVTFMAWIKPTGTMQEINGRIVTFYGHEMFLNSDRTVTYRTYNLTTGFVDASSSAISANAWTHVAATYNQTRQSLYVNGALAAYASYSNGTLRANTNGLFIGALGIGDSDSNRPFNGTIDEVAVYNRSLTAEEINASYHAGLDSGFAKNGDILAFKWGGNATLFNISSWAANTWSHVAGTWDSTFVKLYVDGNLKSTARSVLPSSVNDTLYVGSHWTGTGQANAWIDELRVSNASRNFTVTLIANVTQPATDVVRVYNHANTLMNTSGSMGGVSSYNVSLNLSASSEYRIEVTDTSGNTFEKWYPYRTGGACAATTTLDTVKFSTANCPEVTDTYYGSDVTFANCP